MSGSMPHSWTSQGPAWLGVVNQDHWEAVTQEPSWKAAAEPCINSLHHSPEPELLKTFFRSLVLARHEIFSLNAVPMK